MKITEAELAAALDKLSLPPSSFTLIPVESSPVHELAGVTSQAAMIRTGYSIASQVFRIVRDLRAEAARWVPGALYQKVIPVDGEDEPVIMFYLRTDGGWNGVAGFTRLADGSVDTSGFRRLVAEGS